MENAATALIFLHIPKSAGSTLSRVIDWEYDPLRICYLDGRFYFWAFRSVTKWPAHRLAQIQVFKGHMPFGLHRVLPQASTYMTALREPIGRVISEYYYRLQHNWTHPIANHAMKDLTLEEYVTTVPYDNVQTKMLAGADTPYDFFSGPCSADMLEIAKDNMSRHFSLVGLTERFEETLALAKILFGWKIDHYTSIRENRGRPKKEQVPPHIRALIGERNAFDVALYQFGVSLFNDALARHTQRVQIETEAIRSIKKLDSAGSLRYRLASIVRKQFIRARCDLQSVTANRPAFRPVKMSRI